MFYAICPSRAIRLFCVFKYNECQTNISSWLLFCQPSNLFTQSNDTTQQQDEYTKVLNLFQVTSLIGTGKVRSWCKSVLKLLIQSVPTFKISLSACNTYCHVKLKLNMKHIYKIQERQMEECKIIKHYDVWWYSLLVYTNWMKKKDK